jgi:hypothetical protein
MAFFQLPLLLESFLLDFVLFQLPEKLGHPMTSLSALRGGGASHSIEITLAIWNGRLTASVRKHRRLGSNSPINHTQAARQSYYLSHGLCGAY